MWKRELILCIFFALLLNTSFGQGIIIDHTCTDVDQIPVDIIENIKFESKFEWAATSHGHQVLTGLKLLESEIPYLDVTIGDGETGYENGGYLPDPNGSFCIMDGLISLFAVCGQCCLGIGADGYWQGTESQLKIEKTIVSCFPDINITGWGWCTELNSYSQEQVQGYLDTITLYESLYPNVRFIYSTGTAEGDGDGGYNRFLRNNQIREYCIQNNKVLFDFADLECWSNDEMNYYIHEGDTVPLQHLDYKGDTHHHTNALNCLNKGKAAWYMMARLQGWESESIRLNIRLFLEGPFNGFYMSSNLNSGGYIPLSQPYNTSPWFYNGQESIPSIPNNFIIDWVLLELRDATSASMATPQKTIARKAAFLNNHGYIVDLDGNSDITIDSNFDNSLYVVIWHRNHLGVMSANPLIYYDGVYYYDFSNGSSQAFGDNLAHSPINPVLWGLSSGNGNGDYEINISDKTDIWQNQAGMDGYYLGDFNLDGQVNSLDKNEKWMGNIGKDCHVPQ